MTDSLAELEKERAKRDINKSNMSILVGYQSSYGWMQAINNGHDPKDKIAKAKIVIEYHDENGYIPTPTEVRERYE